QLIPDIDSAIIVTTPQDVAILDSTKSVMFAKELNISFIGIIENMSGFICPHCSKETELFGAGGGEKAASDLKVSFLGRIPIEPEIVKLGDSGQPFIHFRKNSSSAENMDEIINRIITYEKNNKS
ncbi:MAG: P-loop NTPase, partial [Candidatus Omnitrophica bacterium]|nr:P-loop NTPase [Candidatus Omnitrophota bacterium]